METRNPNLKMNLDDNVLADNGLAGIIVITNCGQYKLPFTQDVAHLGKDTPIRIDGKIHVIQYSGSILTFNNYFYWGIETQRLKEWQTDQDIKAAIGKFRPIPFNLVDLSDLCLD